MSSLSMPSPVIPPSAIPVITAGRRFIENPDTREAITLLLPRSDLLNLMKVNRVCFADAVRAIYPVVLYDQMPMISQSPRAAIYSAAVRQVNIWGSGTIAKMSRMLAGTSWQLPPTRYDAETLHSFLEPLTFQCRYLRGVAFVHSDCPGCSSGCSWVVTLSEASSPSPLAGDSLHDAAGPSMSGHIQFMHRCVLDPNGPPPHPFSSYHRHLSPPPNYTATHRFNLASTSSASSSMHKKEWVSAVREADFAKDLHDRIELSTLEILSLGDLTQLYKRQQAAGRKERDRLHFIKAEGVMPFDINDFITFSTIASTSLVTLDLGSKVRAIRGLRGELLRENLADFLAVVRTRLVNLEELTMGIEDKRHVERDCSAVLSEGSLNGGGSIKTLRITFLEGVGPPYLNLIRVLAQLCTSEASIHIGGEDEKAEQTKYLTYLLAQCPTRKKHLAVVDFASLFIHSLDQVSELEYDQDDRPIRRSATEPAVWYDRLAAVRKAVSGILSHDIEALITTFAEDTGHLSSLSATASAQHVMSAAQGMVRSATATRRALARVTKIGIEDIDEVVTDLRRFIYHPERVQPEFKR